MLKRFFKVLFWTVAANGLAISVSFASCGCPQATSSAPAQDYGYPQAYQQEVIRAEVKNYDCSAPAPVYEPTAPVYQESAPAPVAVRTRQAPEKVYYMANVEQSQERRRAPLSNAEMERRSRVETVEYRFADTVAPAPVKAKSEIVMSSRSARQQVFNQTPVKKCRDGSIFGGGSCERKDKNGSIFGGGPCKNCTKNGSIFGGGPCKNCTKNGSIFGGGPCKNCTKNGSIFGGGSCKNCKTPCEKAKCSPCAAKTCAGKTTCQQPLPCQQTTPCQQAAPQAQPCPQPVAPAPKPACVKKYELQEVERSCKDFAPLSMEWVDFRIIRGDAPTYSRNLGKYRFRIFGCRRNSKNAILNEGRIVEKDMNFIEIFSDMVSDCYTVVDTQKCVDENTVLPEYVLTAEITDYFMNICDEYNWDEARMENSRNGSAEMTVTWRLMDASKSNVLWKGESKGYAEIEDGEYNGEMILIQRAFADAADNLRYLPGFEDQLAVRVSPEEMENQRKTLMELQRASGICQFRIIEDFGSVSSGYGVEESWIEVKETPAPVPTPTPIVEVRTPEVEIEVETPIVPPAPVIQVEAPAPAPVAAGAIYEADKLCIVERADIENMGPETVGETKNSVISVTNAKGKNGAGLLISEQFVMTSADLVDRENNNYSIVTSDGRTLQARAFRVNPRRNTALLVLSENGGYAPLPLALELPPVGKGSYIAPAPTLRGDMSYLNNTARVSSYRYTRDGTAEIVVDAFEPQAIIGTALIDEKGRVAGLAHRVQDGDANLFLPLETAMRSLGIEICGKAFPEARPKPVEKVWRKPVSEYIDKSEAKAPEAMPAKTRK